MSVLSVEKKVEKAIKFIRKGISPDQQTKDNSSSKTLQAIGYFKSLGKYTVNTSSYMCLILRLFFSDLPFNTVKQNSQICKLLLLF